MKTNKDYFENEKNITSIFIDKCGTVNIIGFKAFTNESRRTGKPSYIVITRKGILNFYGDALIAYYEGKKNIDYKEFAAKKAANDFIKKNINNK
jgi:hypothetical protein